MKESDLFAKKEALRSHFQKVRNGLPKKRVEGAKKALLHHLTKNLPLDRPTLSFFPIKKEIDLSLFNESLLSNRALLLPRVEEEKIIPYQMSNLEEELERGGRGFFQPIPHLAKQFPIEKIAVVLLPGLAFDRTHHRLGYGKGHYDRFLSTLSPQIKTVALGFKEQLTDKPLPVDPHDQKVDELWLF